MKIVFTLNRAILLLVKSYFLKAICRIISEDGSLMDIKKGDIGMRYGRQWHSGHSEDNWAFLHIRNKTKYVAFVIKIKALYDRECLCELFMVLFF